MSTAELVAPRPNWPFGDPHGDSHDNEEREGEPDEWRKLAKDRAIAGQRGHGTGVFADRNRGPRTMRRVAKVYPRKPSGRDGDRANGCVIVLVLEALQEVLHLCDRHEVILAAETFCSATPQVDADAIDRAVGLEMAVRRRVVDRDLQRRVLSRSETGGEKENERGREAPNESRDDQVT